MKLWLWAVPLLASVGYVAAQSGPRWPQDYVPGVGEIETVFESKMDLNGLITNAITAAGGVFGRTIPDRAGDFKGPADFLSSGQTATQLTNGVINAVPALNAAQAAGLTTLPCGTYRLDGPLDPMLTAGMGLIAQNPGCVTFNINFATGDVITVGDMLNTYHGGSTRISGIHFNAVVTRSSGYVIHVLNTHEVRLDNFTIDGPIFGGVEIQGGGIEYPTTAISFLTHLDNFEISGGSDSCIWITDYALNTYLSGGVASGCKDDLHIDHASGVYGVNVDLGQATHDAILVNPGGCVAGVPCGVNAVFLSNVTGDTASNAGIEFTGTGDISEVYFSNVWGSGATAGSGFVLNAPQMSGFTCAPCDAHGNSKHGFDIEAGGRITIGSGSKALMNSRAGLNLYDGIYVASGVGNVIIDHVQSGDGGYFSLNGAAQFQKYGLELAASTSNMVIADNNFGGNATGGALIGTTAGSRIHDNIGYNTSSSGTGIIGLGNTTATIATGLQAPDAQIVVTVSPTVNLAAAGVLRLWSQTVSGGSFLVSADSPTTANLFFNWTAKAYGN